MISAVCHLKSAAPYGQSKYIQTPRGDKETADAHEKRCWRERMHVTTDGNVFIPPTSFKNCLSDAAKYLSIQIPGKGKSTYTKHFEAGVMVVEALVLPIKAADVPATILHVPADGRRGGTKRVVKYFPTIHEWEGDVEFLILDETITKEVFTYHLSQAGKFIGLGFFRPRNNGFWGRFSVEAVKWGEVK